MINLLRSKAMFGEENVYDIDGVLQFAVLKSAHGQ